MSLTFAPHLVARSSRNSMWARSPDCREGRPLLLPQGPSVVTGVMRGAANGKPGLSESAPQGRGARLMGPRRPHAPQRPEHALPAALPLTGLLMWGHQGEVRKRLSGLLISFLNSQDDRPLPSRAVCQALNSRPCPKCCSQLRFSDEEAEAKRGRTTRSERLAYCLPALQGEPQLPSVPRGTGP